MLLNPLNAELNPICHLLALLGAHHILHVSRIRVNVPITVATRSEAWVCGPSLSGIAGSNSGWGMECCECCVLSGRGLCDGLISGPEDFYRLWCVWVSLWKLENEVPSPTGDCRAITKILKTKDMQISREILLNNKCLYISEEQHIRK